MEGNNFFQVVWLPDERREEYLKTIKKMADDQNRPPASQIVFEGNFFPRSWARITCWDVCCTRLTGPRPPEGRLRLAR